MKIRQLREAEKKNTFKRKPNSLYTNHDGHWGYYINPYFENVVNYMKQNELKSLIDLGAGEGHVVELLNDMGFQAKGYEIEDELIEQYHKIFGRNNIEKKDITYLTVEDIKDFEVIYFYVPFKDLELLNIFLTNVMKIIQPNQTILFEPESEKYYRKNKKPYMQQFTEKKVEKYRTLEVFKFL